MKRPNLFLALVVVATLVLGACGSDTSDASASGQGSETSQSTGTVRLWVKPALVDCEGAGPQTCMQIAESEDGEYEYFYDQIAGFAFVEGVSFVIDVTVEEIVDPPADGSSLLYTLVEVVEEHVSN